ncbi:Prostaglandin E synthase 3 (Cytosolic) [Chytridiales sp. JEL 0842]|nr:Prostaglandin E synthase 3 (Cytosolic) [Chytridiales sp. JEL 0842]
MELEKTTYNPIKFNRTSGTIAPEILWAQRPNEIYLTINVSDVENPKVKLEANTFTFTGVSHGKTYEAKLELLKEIDPEESKQNISARSLYFVLAKKEKDQPYWSRLLKASGKPHFLKTDFSRWKDEDESDDEGGAGKDFDMSNFGGMGGMGDMASMMGGMGGMDMASMMGGMGGMAGMGGGAGGMDFSKFGGAEGADSDDDDDMPGLEENDAEQA